MKNLICVIFFFIFGAVSFQPALAVTVKKEKQEVYWNTNLGLDFIDEIGSMTVLENVFLVDEVSNVGTLESITNPVNASIIGGTSYVKEKNQIYGTYRDSGSAAAFSSSNFTLYNRKFADVTCSYFGIVSSSGTVPCFKLETTIASSTTVAEYHCPPPASAGAKVSGSHKFRLYNDDFGDMQFQWKSIDAASFASAGSFACQGAQFKMYKDGWED